VARLDNEVRMVPSILDRLVDDDPSAKTAEPISKRSQNVREMRRAVARDLEALLNTRQEVLHELPAEFTETNRSLVTYGLPDFSSFDLLSVSDRNRIRRALEQAIATFEPRLGRVRAVLETPREHDRAIRFRVEALLRVDPTPEAVTFDAVLRLSTQEYVIQGHD
jgi:type VI secretion system protein ImpF